jgi:hypothetical protein
MNSKKSIILLACLCLTFNSFSQGAYSFLLRGQKSPYDSAVSIEIHEYRKIRFKLTTSDSLVVALISDVRAAASISLEKDSAISTLLKENSVHLEIERRQQKSFSDLNKNFNDLYIKSISKGFFQRPGVLVGMGSAGTFIVIAIVKSVFK